MLANLQTKNYPPLLRIKAQAEIELRRRRRKREKLLEDKKKVWREKPELYAKERLGIDLTSEQVEILYSVKNNRRTAVKAHHSLGKTFVAAIALLWWIDCWNAHIGYITAPTWGQALRLTFKQAKRLAMINKLDFEILESGWIRDRDKFKQTERFIQALNADSGEGFQGEHTAPILIVLDEATGVKKYIFEATEGLMTNADCVVGETQVSASQISAATSRFYQGEVIKITTAGNRNLTVTPNHPILTRRGWVAAKFVNESDELVASLNPQSVSAGIIPNKENIETAISDVFVSLIRRFGYISRAGNVLDFHGDGLNSKINIVDTTRLLRSKTQTSGGHICSERGFGFSHLPKQFNSLRSLASGFGTLGRAFNGAVCGFSKLRPFTGGHFGHSEFAGLANSSSRTVLMPQSSHNGANGDSVFAPQISDSFPVSIFGGESFRRIPPVVSDATAKFNADIFEVSGKRFSFNSNLFSELVASFPGEITLDKVVQVVNDDFSGQVYNLHTKNNWYFANGIITHNCRVLEIANPTDEGTDFGEHCESANYEVFSFSALDHDNIEAELKCLPAPYNGAISLTWLFEKLRDEAETVDENTEDVFEFYSLETIEKALNGRCAPEIVRDENGNIIHELSGYCYYKPTAYFQGRVLGEFPTEASTKVIAKGWVKTLPVLEINPAHTVQIGSDVARFGDDRTTIFARIGSVCLRAKVLRKFDGKSVAAAIRDMAIEVCEYLKQFGVNLNPKKILINVDITGGLGTEPLGFLLDWGYKAIGINSSESAKDNELYLNKRSELWFEVRDRIKYKNVDISRLPADIKRELIKELGMPTYEVRGGKKVVEPKEKIKKRLKVSPDLADGFNLCFYETVPFEVDNRVKNLFGGFKL